MSVVTLQIGQCGNQVGSNFFDSIMQDVQNKKASRAVSFKENQEYVDCILEKFFTESESNKTCKWTARAVMIDMEQKVIQQLLKTSGKSASWIYSDKSYLHQKKGAGNNWAYGYFNQSPLIIESVMEKFGKQLENCDRIGGIAVLMSVAGGTGSGLGTYITQKIRDELPRVPLINEVIWPYSSGEVIVQNYNALLTLHHLSQATDALLIFENDQIHKICHHSLHMEQISMEDLNDIIGQKLVSILAPARNSNKCCPSLSNMLEHLVSHPAYKILTLRNAPYTPIKSQEFESYSWAGILKHLHQMVACDSLADTGINWELRQPKETPGSSNVRLSHPKAVANLLVCRGPESFAADSSMFQDSSLYPSWLSPNEAFQCWSEKRPFWRSSHSAALLSNDQSVLRLLKPLQQKTWRMFSTKAYMHQYARYGLTEEVVADCFVTLAQTIHNYEIL